MRADHTGAAAANQMAAAALRGRAAGRRGHRATSRVPDASRTRHRDHNNLKLYYR
jgi:hypothetical protein